MKRKIVILLGKSIVGILVLSPLAVGVLGWFQNSPVVQLLEQYDKVVGLLAITGLVITGDIILGLIQLVPSD